jgi:multidrug/hemolysin transport system ATP-binding protein
MEKIIEVKGLFKSYGEVQAVKGIDFYVEKGKLFAFLGPNGAGKSTTINVICTLLRYEQGSVMVDGFELGKEDAKIREQIGIVFQDTVLDNLLTVEENLRTRGSFYKMTPEQLSIAVEQAMTVTDIVDLRDRRYGQLSGGQRRRTDIARALVHRPKILFLDEPTTGLDPQTRKSVWNMIENLYVNQGVTVFLTTHYMEEASKADYVIVIDNGLIVAKGTPIELKEKYSSDSLQIKPIDKTDVLKKLKAAKLDFYEISDIIVINLQATIDAMPILKMLDGAISAFQVLNGTMDDAFIGITGKEMRV